MVVQNVLDDLPDGKGLIYRIPVGIRVTVVLHLEAKDVVVRDGVGDGILVQAFLEYILGGDILGLLAVYACIAAFSSNIGVPVKPKSWAFGKKFRIAA